MNCAILLRRSSKPKFMLGRESAIDGASVEASGGRMALVESDGSKEDIFFEVTGEGIWAALLFSGACCLNHPLFADVQRQLPFRAWAEAVRPVQLRGQPPVRPARACPPTLNRVISGIHAGNFLLSRQVNSPASLLIILEIARSAEHFRAISEEPSTPQGAHDHPSR